MKSCIDLQAGSAVVGLIHVPNNWLINGVASVTRAD